MNRPSCVWTFWLVSLVLFGGCGLVTGGEGEAPVPARLVVVSGDGQVALPGAALANPLVVEVRDGEGAPLSGLPISWQAGDDASVNPNSGTSGEEGRAQATVTLGSTAGSYMVEARVEGTALLAAFSATARTDETEVDHYSLAKVSGDNQVVPPGTPLGVPLVVSVTDGGGDPVSGATVQWSTGSAGASLPSTSVTGNDGLGSVTPTLGGNEGPYVFTAEVSGASSSVVFQAEAAAVPVLLKVSGDQQVGGLGRTLPESLVVEKRNADGATVAGVTIYWAASGDAGVTATRVTDAVGQVSVTPTLGSAPGGYTFTAATGEGTSATFTAETAPASELEKVSGDGQSGQGGAPLEDPLVLEAQDVHGTPIPGVTVSWSASGGASVTSSTVTGSDGRVSVTPTLAADFNLYTFTASLGGTSASAQFEAAVSNVLCWGRNHWGQTNVPVDLVGEGHIGESLAAGASHSCGVDTAGGLRCWGRNDLGQDNVPPGHVWESVTAGADHNCAMDASGTVACWGSNGEGQTDLPPGHAWESVSAGGRHTCGIDTTGDLLCWGIDLYNLLDVPSGHDWDTLTSGAVHNCGFDATGDLLCWGSDIGGESSGIPSGHEWEAVMAGDANTCGIDTSGALLCWGVDYFGEADVPPGHLWETVSGGSRHICGIDTTGTLRCWGDNEYGQLEVPQGHVWKDVAAGYWHTCGIIE